MRRELQVGAEQYEGRCRVAASVGIHRTGHAASAAKDNLISDPTTSRRSELRPRLPGEAAGARSWSRCARDQCIDRKGDIPDYVNRWCGYIGLEKRHKCTRMQACRIAFAGFGNFYDPCRDELAQYVRARGSHNKIARFIECHTHDTSCFIVEKDIFGGRWMHKQSLDYGRKASPPTLERAGNSSG